MKFGPSFPELIQSEKPAKRQLFFDGPPRGYQRTRSLLFWGILAAAILLFSLFKLQILQGLYYRQLADGNRVRSEIIYAPRGIIYDRNREPLVHNIPGFRMETADGKTKAVGKDEALLLLSQENPQRLKIDSLRQYVSDEVFAHVLGYIGEISQEELIFRPQTYRGGDFIGKTGVEKTYETTLRGKDGRELFEVDSLGHPSRVLGKVEPVAGQDVVLSIDQDLSKVAFEAMKEVERGALIASNPQTGEILAVISKPSYDPNLFTLGDEYKPVTTSAYQTIDSILSDEENRPLFNRAVSGTYPPGSTFKIITAAAGLESGVINDKTEIEDIGIITIGNFSFPNWYFIQYGKLEGKLNIVGAIKRSNDIFFYKVAELTGLTNLEMMAKKFGLSAKLGIDLPGEETGLFPTDEWKRKVIGDKWYLGDTYHLGIGQGYLLTTPLQINAWTSVIANNGALCQPTIIKNSECRIKNKKFLSEKTISLIREGMREACAPGGTGWPLFKFKVKNEKLKVDEKNFFKPDDTNEDGWVHIPVACKTGTAEFGDPQGRTHAWFTAFAPVEEPELVVTVLVEGGGEGSNVAAPIAKKVLEEWFSR